MWVEMCNIYTPKYRKHEETLMIIKTGNSQKKTVIIKYSFHHHPKCDMASVCSLAVTNIY